MAAARLAFVSRNPQSKAALVSCDEIKVVLRATLHAFQSHRTITNWLRNFFLSNNKRQESSMDHLQSMRVFVKVADLGSFARAASAMDISNAVATRHVADLEGRLGTRLLNRTTRSLSLTESGQVYLERARQILDELEDVEQMVVARNHEPVGTLRIVAPVVFG